ncbi:YlaH-like family protein [Radiobacillus sp. PE A8.2]|uniref:YlaH-like family protein n=1 Tax=Radiobacillus sp. PE A8.2 TaxID=3380349 RepID=UPI00388F044F
MIEQESIQIPDHLGPITTFFMNSLGGEVNLANDDELAILFRGLFFLYVTIVILTVICYKLGFAKQLPLLKSAIVYVILAIGCIGLTFFAILGLPVAECMIVIALVLGIYRFRLYQERKKRT